MDFGWIPKAVVKREFVQADLEGQPRKRKKRSASTQTVGAAFLMGVGLLSLAGYRHQQQQHRGGGSTPPPVESDGSGNTTVSDYAVFDGCGGSADALPGCKVRVSLASTCP
jgi:hypothetical protein